MRAIFKAWSSRGVGGWVGGGGGGGGGGLAVKQAYGHSNLFCFFI